MQTSDKSIGRQSAPPCAACKLLRRRCTDKCVLAPHFPSNDAQRFAVARILEDLPVDMRADAVSSLVYEASARLRNPVYGCTGAIWQLQRQISELQSQLAIARAELLQMNLLQANLVELITTPVHTERQDIVESFSTTDSALQYRHDIDNGYCIPHEKPVELWEALWK